MPELCYGQWKPLCTWPVNRRRAFAHSTVPCATSRGAIGAYPLAHQERNLCSFATVSHMHDEFLHEKDAWKNRHIHRSQLFGEANAVMP